MRTMTLLTGLLIVSSPLTYAHDHAMDAEEPARCCFYDEQENTCFKGHLLGPFRAQCTLMEDEHGNVEDKEPCDFSEENEERTWPMDSQCKPLLEKKDK